VEGLKLVGVLVRVRVQKEQVSPSYIEEGLKMVGVLVRVRVQKEQVSPSYIEEGLKMVGVLELVQGLVRGLVRVDY
jgi:hypothetical protein